jgi:hypothetical protein
VDLQPLGGEVSGRVVADLVGDRDERPAVRITASWPSTSRRIISLAGGASSASGIDDRRLNAA